jgi:hypothetical protein
MVLETDVVPVATTPVNPLGCLAKLARIWVADPDRMRLPICGGHGWLTRLLRLEDRKAFAKHWIGQYPGALLLHI